MSERFVWVTAVGTSQDAPSIDHAVSKLPALARVVGRENGSPLVSFLPEYRRYSRDFSEWVLLKKEGDRWSTHTLKSLPDEACAALMREALTHAK